MSSFFTWVSFTGFLRGTLRNIFTKPNGFLSLVCKAYFNWLWMLSVSCISLCPGSQNFCVIILTDGRFCMNSIMAEVMILFLFCGTHLHDLDDHSQASPGGHINALAISFPDRPLSVSGHKAPYNSRNLQQFPTSMVKRK